MLRASLSDTYEIKCREKEEDLIVLRREMLEAVTKFSSDKQHWEREIEQKNYELHDEKVNYILLDYPVHPVFFGYNKYYYQPEFDLRPFYNKIHLFQEIHAVEVQSLKADLEAMEKKLKHRGKEIKKLRKDFDQMSKKTRSNDSGIVSTDVVAANTSERAIKIARILEAIDSID